VAFSISFATSLFVTSLLIAIVRFVRDPKRGNWWLSAVCTFFVYWFLLFAFMLTLKVFGLDLSVVRKAPLGLEAFAVDAYIYGLPALGGLFAGVKLAPNRRLAFVFLSAFSLLWAIIVFVNDTKEVGYMVSLWVPVITLIAIALFGWLTGFLNPQSAISPGERMSDVGYPPIVRSGLQSSKLSPLRQNVRAFGTKTTNHVQ
jgi:hypothetical protein